VLFRYFRFIKAKIIIFVFFVLSFVAYSAQDFITYQVSKGDTFYSLSKRFNVEIWEIQKINGITELKAGQVIKIPNRTLVEYKVKKGDTLFSLAKKYNSTIEEILSLNNISDFNIKDGQIIRIPVKKSDFGTDKALDTRKKYSRKVYVVKRGDTLYSIARRLDVSVEHLAKINGLSKNSVLREGMIILVDYNNSVVAKNTTKNNTSSENVKKVAIIPSFSLPFSSVVSVENKYDRFIDVYLSKPEFVNSLYDGVVIFVGTFGVFGRTVIVKHGDGFYGVYGLLRDVYVENGQKVAKGQRIGSPVFDDDGRFFRCKLSFIVGDKMVVPNDKKLVKL